MPRIRDRPRSGAFLRSSVHLEQIGGVGPSCGRGNSLAIAPSYVPLCSTNRNHPTVRLASSFFCQSPRTDGSAARLGKVEIASIANVRRRAFKADTQV